MGAKSKTDKVAAMKSKINKIAQEYGFDVDFSNVNKQRISFTMDQNTVAPAIETVFDMDSNIDDLTLDMAYHLLISNAKIYLNDDDIEKLLGSKLQHDPDHNVVYDHVQAVCLMVKHHREIAYEMRSCVLKHKYPLKYKPDNKPSDYERLLTQVFNNWCKNIFVQNDEAPFSMVNIPFLEYPAKACLRYNTVDRFYYDLQDSDIFLGSDVAKVQDALINGYGIEEGKMLE